MSVNAADITLRAPALRLLTAAPHRLLFFVGATNVLLAMAWWTARLIDMRWQWFGFAQPHVPAGWLHAIVMQYQVLPTFMFGFLLTVFPRWMNQPALTRGCYLPIGIGLLGGQLFTLLGALGSASLLLAGALFTLVGWAVGLWVLGATIWRDGARTWHAVSCHIALCFGWIGFFLYALYLRGGDAHWMFAAIKIGGIALLLPIFFTVCHRMIPFFASCVFADYRVVRPMWTLTLFWALALGHLWLELGHGYAWLWIVDAPLSILGIALLRLWWPTNSAMPALLRVLFLAFAWLPIACALFAAQSIWYAISGEFLLGRAPAHALFIGFFGSLLVAMVTRVTQGHSGRPLVLGGVAGFAFVLVQAVAVLRIVAELAPDALVWQVLASLAWLVAFLPWVFRSAWIYLTPRRS